MVKIFTKKWKIEKIKGIIFDKDGTIIDSHLYWGKIIEERARAIIEKYNLSNKLFLGLCLAMGYSHKKKKLLSKGPIALVSREEVINIIKKFLLLKGLNIKCSGLESIFNKVHNDFIKYQYNYLKLLPGISDFLSLLKREKVRMAVVTSDSYKNTVEIFKKLKILNYFDAVIGRETVNEPKITGKPALEALKLLKINKTLCVCIGDALQDIVMSDNCGIKRCIAVATGQISIKCLEKYSSYVVNSIKLLTVATQ